MTRGKCIRSNIALVRETGRPTSVSSGRRLALLGAAADPERYMVNELDR
jgi:hypothetical protein